MSWRNMIALLTNNTLNYPVRIYFSLQSTKSKPHFYILTSSYYLKSFSNTTILMFLQNYWFRMPEAVCACSFREQSLWCVDLSLLTGNIPVTRSHDPFGLCKDRGLWDEIWYLAAVTERHKTNQTLVVFFFRKSKTSFSFC